MSSLPLGALNRVPPVVVHSVNTPEIWYGAIAAVDSTAVDDIADALAPGERTTTSIIIPVSDGAGALLRFASLEASDNETGIFRIERLKRMRASHTMTVSSVPVGRNIEQFGSQVLGSVTVTIGTKTGVAAGVITDSMHYCDTATITTNRGFEGQLALAPDPSAADDAPTEIKVDAACCDLLRISLIGGTAGDSDQWFVGVQIITAS